MARSLWLVSLFWVVATAMPENVPLGGAPGAMQRAGFGARSQGLGNASVALADPGVGSQANPALLAMTGTRTLRAGGSLLSFDRREAFLVYKQRMRANTAIGGSWLYREIPEFDLVDDNEEIIGTSSESYHAAQIGLAYRPRRTWAVGAAIGYFKQRVHEFNSSAVGIIDLGLCFLPSRKLTAGFALKNLPLLSGNVPWQVSTGTDWNAVADFQLPFHTKTGLCYEGKVKTYAYRIVLEEDVFFWQDQTPRWLWAHSEHAGVEAWITPRFAVRTGYDRGRFPLGFGINDIWKGVNLDYCITLERNAMGLNHSLEWECRF